jgi:hypothetical protein
MKQAHRVTSPALSWLAFRAGASIIGLAAVWIVSSPRLACGQSAVWQPQGATTGNIYYNGGNVGIGTLSPSYKFDVQGSIRANGGQVFVTNTPTSSSGIALYGGTDGVTSGVYIWNPSSQYNTYLGDGTYNSYINARGGNVGIGTTNPTYKLSVNGSIRAKEIIVDTGWSDYVFHPNYRLRPLNEVAAYIRANHHLPDIPSEAEVQEKGVSLGEMQSKLLAKIEELTLHVIQEHERNDRLEQQNREIMEKVARLLAH